MSDLDNQGILLLLGQLLEGLEVNNEFPMTLDNLISPGLRLRDFHGVSHKLIIQPLALFFLLFGFAHFMVTASCLNLKFLFQLLNPL